MGPGALVVVEKRQVCVEETDGPDNAYWNFGAEADPSDTTLGVPGPLPVQTPGGMTTCWITTLPLPVCMSATRLDTSTPVVVTKPLPPPPPAPLGPLVHRSDAPPPPPK